MSAIELETALKARGWRHETPDSFYTDQKVWRKWFGWFLITRFDAAAAWEFENNNDL